MEAFEEAYTKLNPAQKKAVDTIEGPVMVVAGPGTGKTQVLALRIAHILKQTDAGADAVLCLTFTRSGVHAMRERLERYIGKEAQRVAVATFHSFAGDLISMHYALVGFDRVPELLDDTGAVLLIDEMLHAYEWEYIRPRTNPSQYFGDLRQLMSILKRERMTPALFLNEVEQEITSLKQDPESISSRGPSKGQIKKEVEKKIESLERTKEVVAFYRLYEDIKKERALMDYDDVLEYAVALVETSEDVRADIRETYQYVLVDEHQDSSGVQNAFLKAVWQDSEQPNIFVVGDDRQLIYGFSGASLSYFEEFGSLFGRATLITLSNNYRSSDRILALADTLLQSSVSKEPLVGAKGEGVPVGLYQYAYERDELVGMVRHISDVIQKGVSPQECAVLVPRNRHVRTALSLFRAYGIPVASHGGAALFDEADALSFMRVLKIIATPFDSVLLAESMLDATSGILPFEAHTFIHAQKGRAFSIDTMIAWGTSDGLFSGQSAVSLWGEKLRVWIDTYTHTRVGEVISGIGTELLVKRTQSQRALVQSVEIVRSFLHSALAWEERTKDRTLGSYIAYLTRLMNYHQDIPLASFESQTGVHVMTLHRSKGLEFEHVWIAHVNEETVMGQKRSAFTLPQTVADRLEARDALVVTRELYVAITRAKSECVLSYAAHSYDDRELTLSSIIQNLPDVHFSKKSVSETEAQLLLEGPLQFVALPQKEAGSISHEDIATYVREHYTDTKVSVTLLNNFFDCPWKWYFRNFLKLPEVKGVSLALGSAVHSTIEYILKSGAVPAEEDLKVFVASMLEKEGVYDEGERARLGRDALRALLRWVKEYYPTLEKDYTSERSVSFKDDRFPHLHMYGKIDLTERTPYGDIVVTDFKTGSVKTGTSIEKRSEEGRLSDYMRQLAMYSYLIRGAEDRDVARSRLLFVEADAKDKHALYETHISDEQIDLLVRDIREYDEALKSGEWVDRECHHKGYGAQTECEYCALAKVIKK